MGSASIRVALIDRMAPSVQQKDDFDGRATAVAVCHAHPTLKAAIKEAAPAANGVALNI